MSEVTVTQFAETIGVPVDRLLSQLKDAGIGSKAADEIIGDEDKVKLLDYLRQKHGTDKQEEVAEAGPKKITLQRRTTSELKVGGSAASKGKTVTVEVRKKRTYVKRSLVEAEEDKRIDGEVAKRLEQQLEVEAKQRAEEDARRQAEAEVAKRQAEEEAARQAEKDAKRQAEEEEATRRTVEEVAVQQPVPPEVAKPSKVEPRRKHAEPEAAKPAEKKAKGKKK